MFQKSQDLSYDGYRLVWREDFHAAALDRRDWNVELHEPGWVNAEWQAYVDSPETIFLRDGTLVIRPVKRIGSQGNDVYLSGRINTKGKHEFRYGIFEARARVPAGKGFLPAFWMMPTDEFHYGPWPVCGEMDILEIMGQNPAELYGTLHYGLPHEQSQGTFLLPEGSFAEGYHLFSLEWLPQELRWYVDGTLYHSENIWFSAKAEQVSFPYPAPFDRPFYLILNLAVGGEWVGYPDRTTDFSKAEFCVDEIRVYQKPEQPEAQGREA